MASDRTGHVDNSSGQLGFETGGRGLIAAEELGLAKPLFCSE
jgi:hypothetical protein